MSKRTIYNYYIKTIDDEIFFSIHFDQRKMFFYKYYNDIVSKEIINDYSIKHNIIKFNNNIFSNNMIKYSNIIDIKFEKKRNMFYNKILYTNFSGLINNSNVFGKVYLDKETYSKMPLEYNKMLYLSDNFDFLFSSILNKNINDKTIKLYFDINDNVIKDNSYIAYRNKENKFTIKTYQYIYNIDIVDKTCLQSNDNLFNFYSINANVSINKTFHTPFINTEKKNMLLITYNFSNNL